MEGDSENPEKENENVFTSTRQLLRKHTAFMRMRLCNFATGTMMNARA